MQIIVSKAVVGVRPRWVTSGNQSMQHPSLLDREMSNLPSNAQNQKAGEHASPFRITKQNEAIT
jgi:hypothetical protein